MKCRVFFRNPSGRWVEAQIRYLDEVTIDQGLSGAAELRIEAALLRDGTYISRKGFKLQSVEYPNGQQKAAA